LITRVNTCRNRNRSSIDGSRASNIGRRIADHTGILASDWSLKMIADVAERQPSHIVAMRMIIAISAGLKEVINSKMTQFDPRTFRVIAG
jgi:hypothetical protein